MNDIEQLADRPWPPPLGCRGLVIDDEPGVRGVLRSVCEKIGIEVDECSDGAQALELLRADSRRFDVVLCDLRMRHVSGVELHDDLERSMPEILSRTLFVTGDVASPEVVAFVERTRSRLVHKPFELLALAELIEATVLAAPRTEVSA